MAAESLSPAPFVLGSRLSCCADLPLPLGLPFKPEAEDEAEASPVILSAPNSMRERFGRVEEARAGDAEEESVWLPGPRNASRTRDAPSPLWDSVLAASAELLSDARTARGSLGLADFSLRGLPPNFANSDAGDLRCPPARIPTHLVNQCLQLARDRVPVWWEFVTRIAIALRQSRKRPIVDTLTTVDRT